ncbi:MAG: rod shape-determining protein RodA [Bacteroidetes bacterium]|uniref:Cell wall polymerase n=1 Tax=Candidatus Caccoplasma merdipullorum TaxID=2840718 RepID=A0A9D9E3S2_9BACT|nr:rod shape-determining protein RodA [Candidatus Caccoplasma merdipullorum]
MESRNINIWSQIDKVVLLLYAVLVIWGWFSIYAASYNYDDISIFSLDGRAGKQLLWIGCAGVIIFAIMMTESRMFEAWAYPLYVLMMFILALTILIAPNIKGSHSWIVIGPFSIQPAEFAKFAVSLALARFMSSYNFVLTRNWNLLKTVMLILLPLGLIILQKETGTALVYVSLVLMLYREGMSGFILLAGVASITYFVLAMKYSTVIWGITPAGEFIVLTLILIVMIAMIYRLYDRRGTLKILLSITAVSAIIFATITIFRQINWVYMLFTAIAANSIYAMILSIKSNNPRILHSISVAAVSIIFLFSVNYIFTEMLEPHQQMRIRVAFGMEDDPRGAGYNVNQSKIAIGSGGFFGKGYLSGTQTKLKYVPEQDTDFIFCTIGEEMGFVGSVLLITLFVALIIRIITIAERQPGTFGRVYGYCVASILMFHLTINVGMVIGLCPVIGIPLPFFSYGGSSLWGFTILLFTLLRLDASRMERYRW